MVIEMTKKKKSLTKNDKFWLLVLIVSIVVIITGICYIGHMVASNNLLGIESKTYSNADELEILEFNIFQKTRTDEYVQPDIEFINKSDKTIKYLTFKIEFYNQVGDPAKIDYRNSNEHTINIIGPIEKGDGCYLNWETMEGAYIEYDRVYCPEFSTAILDYVEIEYMDGTINKIQDINIPCQSTW